MSIVKYILNLNHIEMKFLLKSKMEKNKYYSLFFVLALIFSLTYCQEKNNVEINSDVKEMLDTTFPSDMGGMTSGNLVFPPGTISKITNNGSSLSYTLPDGVIYIALNGKKIGEAKTGSYTCTGTCSSGCDVVKLGSEMGCSACEPKTIACTGKESSPAIFSIGDGEGGGFIDLNAGVSFVTTKEELSNQLTGPDWDILMSHSDLTQAFDTFYKSIWPENKPDVKNSKLAVVNVFGTYVRLYVPLNTAANSRIAMATMATSCGCSTGGSGCTFEKIRKNLIVVGEKCTAGSCTSCTMSSGDIE